MLGWFTIAFASSSRRTSSAPLRYLAKGQSATLFRQVHRRLRLGRQTHAAAQSRAGRKRCCNTTAFAFNSNRAVRDLRSRPPERWRLPSTTKFVFA